MFNEKLLALKQQIDQDLQQVRHACQIEILKTKYLGRKGPIQDLMKALRDVDASLRPKVGKEINDIKQYVETKLQSLLDTLLEQEEQEKIEQEGIDTSLPGWRSREGSVHLLNQFRDEAIDVLKSLGFSVFLAPEVDSDYYNFESLNFAPDHPARDMQDTFYLSAQHLMRTHTTNFQVHAMEKLTPPIRVISPGKCFRNEEVNARSHVMFHQIDGLYIDKGVCFGDLFATMELFLQKLFGSSLKTQFRPSYFPFVEPGVEVDLQCMLCQGRGCAICKQSGWLEVAGAGMVHEEVLKAGGIDPDVYSGFAWGMGIERLVMIKHRIKDIRIFTENDARFLAQFP